jgi:hypothetical protein
MEEYE